MATLRCVAGRWRGLASFTWRGLASFNCSTSDGSSSRIHHAADDDDDDDAPSWTVGHFFPLDTFPYSQLDSLHSLR